MRIWDISPGYLSRSSLLGEHRELHGLISIHINRKKGYSRHPETIRWTNTLGALAFRHELLVEEMRLRGYKHHSPLSVARSVESFPAYLDEPAEQFSLLQKKYADQKQGRIPLPHDVQELWQQHLYSVLARGEENFLELEKMLGQCSFAWLAEKLVQILRQPPTKTELNKVSTMFKKLRPEQRLMTTFLGEMDYWMKDTEYSKSPAFAAFSRSAQ